VRQIKLAIC